MTTQMRKNERIAWRMALDAAVAAVPVVLGVLVLGFAGAAIAHPGDWGGG